MRRSGTAGDFLLAYKSPEQATERVERFAPDVSASVIV